MSLYSKNDACCALQMFLLFTFPLLGHRLLSLLADGWGHRMDWSIKAVLFISKLNHAEVYSFLLVLLEHGNYRLKSEIQRDWVRSLSHGLEWRYLQSLCSLPYPPHFPQTALPEWEINVPCAKSLKSETDYYVITQSVPINMTILCYLPHPHLLYWILMSGC